MAERTPQLKRFSDRDREILTKEGLVIYPSRSTEMAVFATDYTKMFVPKTFDQSYISKISVIRRFNREFRLRLKTDTAQVFWGNDEDLTSLYSNNSGLVQQLLEDPIQARFGWYFDASNRLSYQDVAGLKISREGLTNYSWCDCGFMSGAVLLTVRPSGSHRSQH